MLFLSWAGKSLSAGLKSCSISQLSDSISDFLRKMHLRGVLHGDAEPRNMLWDETRRCPMMVDFEHASIRRRLSKMNTKQKLCDAKHNSLFSNETKNAQHSLAKLDRRPLALRHQNKVT